MPTYTSNYAPTNVAATVTSGTLVAADNQMTGLRLTNTSSSVDVWCAFKPNAAEVDKGIRLPADSDTDFGIDAVPKCGLNVIAESGTVTIAVQKR